MAKHIYIVKRYTIEHIAVVASDRKEAEREAYEKGDPYQIDVQKVTIVKVKEVNP